MWKNLVLLAIFACIASGRFVKHKSKNDWDRPSGNDWDRPSGNDWDRPSKEGWDKRSKDGWDKPSNKDWDVILFTQNWPVTECIQWKQDKSSNECNMADYSHWTVHGMWPTKLGTKGPGFCDPELKFEMSEIENIVEALAYHWLSIHETNGADKDFWKHEWEKHGTCAVALETLDSELKYFGQGLHWNSKYNMSNILSQAGLVPGGEAQTIDTIYSNIRSVTGTDPFVSCYKQKESGKTYLIDVRLCFNKQLNLVDCDGIERREDEHPLTQDCPDNVPIHYPDENEMYNYQYDTNNNL